MNLMSFTAVAGVLNEAKVRYLIVGGLAVNAHGYGRFTHDVDLVVKLSRKNILSAFAALKRLDYRPRVPVTAQDFANANVRKKLIKEKNMQVLQMWSPKHEEMPVDVFVEEPFIFDKEFKSALLAKVDDEPVRFVSLKTLIRMKKAAGRATDKIDLEKLLIAKKLGD